MQVETAGPKNSARISAAGNSLIVYVSEQDKNIMKKNIFVFISLMGIFAGCQIESINEPSRLDKSTVYEASTEVFTPQTKTSMTSDKQVVWSQNDRLAIFQGCTVADEFLVTESSDGKTSADFNIVSDNSEVNGSFSAGTEVPCNVAFYPYAENLSLSGASIDGGTAYEIEGVVLPKVQNNVAGSFANGAFPMIAVTETLSDHTLRFKNVLGAIKLQLKGTQTVKSIKVTGKNNEILSGAAVVTAYTNNIAPAITMTATDEASKSVILNCSDGIQLSEATATEFIIALPPVLFSNGFTVTVTDSESQAYTVGTDKANTILRSSLLVMPAVTLTASGGGDPEEDDDATYIEYVFLNKSYITMMPNTSYILVADIDPIDVTYPTLTWSSSDNSVAEVDQSGKVTAKSDGNVTITALAVGGVSKSCSVTVKTPKTFAPGDYVDYVDELGVNHGKGVVVAGVIWAPVNCGYEPATADYKGYRYGKLYQWGRKYGQGYDSNDASYPSGDNMIQGPVMPSWGSSETYKDAFFYGSNNWCNMQIYDLWVDSEGKKTKMDPCPSGWRVPTYDELYALTKNYSRSTKDNQKGSYFVGEYTYIDGLPQVFFPAAGSRLYSSGNVYFRGEGGRYWSSRPYSGSAYYFNFNFDDGGANMNYTSRAYGYSVRCVQE